MALQPNIALQVQRPEFDDPINSFVKVAQVRNMLTQGQLHQQQLVNEQEALKTHQLANAETERAQGAQRMLADLVSKNTTQGDTGEPVTDHFAVMKGLADAGHAKEATAYNTQRRLDVKSELDNEKGRLDNAEKQIGMVASVFGPVLNGPPEQKEALHQSARAQAVRMFGPQMLQQIPEHYDENFTNQEVNSAVKAQEQIANRREQIKLAHDINKDAPDTLKKWEDLTFNKASATKSQQELDSLRQVLTATDAPKEVLAQLPTMWSQSAADDLAQKAMTAEQRTQNANQAVTRSMTASHNAATEAIAKRNAATAEGHLAETRRINAMEYGPGQIDNWVENLKQNPDSVKELPTKLRGVVGQKFTQTTGLPLPTPLGAATQTQETAARNALDGIDFIRKAVQNPEIANQIGPIMGRLGNAEQAVGTAVGLSPEAERLAQELRTRMRYFVFQEGKAVLGGRLPQQLMGALESSSANVHMDPRMLEGALAGAEGNAQSVLENADKQRFGGKARPAEMRGMSKPPAAIKLKDGRTLTPHDQAAADAFRKDHPDLIAK